MSSLVASVVDGELQISESSQTTDTTASSTLDKDDFLLLLVTEMEYQDPLEPTSNTEYVAQLATFSELEQMINLNTTMTNTSAFDLVGKTVLIQSSTTSGTVEVQGTVQYVSIENGEAYVTVDGVQYSYDDIVEVYDDYYLIEQCLPSLTEQTLTYNHQDASDVTITGVNLGSDDYAASSFAVVLIDSSNETYAIDTSYLSYSNGTVTISSEAFESLEAGTYTVAFVFDDYYSTTDVSSVTLIVTGNVEATDAEEETDTEVEESSSDDGDDTESA